MFSPPRRSTGRHSKLLRGRLGPNPEKVKLTQIAFNSPPMQPCAVCLDASCGDGLRANSLHIIGTKTSTLKIWLFLLFCNGVSRYVEKGQVF